MGPPPKFNPESAIAIVHISIFPILLLVFIPIMTKIRSDSYSLLISTFSIK